MESILQNPFPSLLFPPSPSMKKGHQHSCLHRNGYLEQKQTVPFGSARAMSHGRKELFRLLITIRARTISVVRFSFSYLESPTLPRGKCSTEEVCLSSHPHACSHPTPSLLGQGRKPHGNVKLAESEQLGPQGAWQ